LKSKDSLKNDINSYTDEFNDSIEYLQTLSNQKKTETETGRMKERDKTLTEPTGRTQKKDSKAKKHCADEDVGTELKTMEAHTNDR
jgi:hypothetical protein